MRAAQMKISLSGMLLRMSGELRDAVSGGQLADLESDMAEEIADDLKEQAETITELIRTRMSHASFRKVKA